MENTNEKLISEIHMIRHGITEGTKKHWFYGAMDIPLDKDGVDEVAELTREGIYPCMGLVDPATGKSICGAEGPDLFGEDPAPDFYTSGMLRAEQTFFIIYGAAKHQAIEELKELNFGDFEGHSHEELSGTPLYEAWLAQRGPEAAAPGGESIGHFNERVARGFEKLRGFHSMKELSHRHSKVPAHSVLVCHGGVIGAIMQHTFEGQRENLYKWIPNPGHGYSIILENGAVAGFREF